MKTEKIRFRTLIGFVFLLVLSLFGIGLSSSLSAQAEPSEDITASVTLDQNISLHFYVPASKANADSKMSFSLDGVEGSLQETQGQYNEAKGVWVFTYTGVTPQYMNTTVTATLDNGALTKSLSLREYCDNLLTYESNPSALGLNANSFEKMKTLLADMLAYGAQSQVYTGVNGTPANDGFTASGSDFASVSGDMTNVYANNDPSVWTGATLRFSNNVQLALRFETAVSSPRVGITKNDTETFLTPQAQGNGVYVVYYKDISATEFDETLIAQLYDGETAVGGTLKYSVASYVYAMQDNAKMGALAKATYLYGCSAKAYRQACGLSEVVLIGGTFADGTDTAYLEAGQTISDMTASRSLAADETLIGFIVDDGQNQSLSRGASYVVTDKDVTLTPYVAIQYDSSSSNGEGELFLCGNGSAVDSYDIKPVEKTDVVIDGVVGKEFVFSGAANASFRIRQPYRLGDGVSRTLTYTFVNTGSSALSFTAYQVNSGSLTSDETHGAVPFEKITLSAGEKLVVTLATAWADGTVFGNFNVMCLITMDAAVTDAHLFVSARIDKTKYTATLTGGAVFENGETSVSLGTGSSLPALTLTGENAEGLKKLTGYIVNDGTDTTFVKAGAFTMPAKNVSITPYVAVVFDGKTVNGTGNLDLSEDGSVTVGKEPFANTLLSNSSNATVTRSGAYVVSGDKVGAEYSFTGSQGGQFRIQRSYNLPSTAVKIAYTFRNNGSVPISVTAYLVNSGVNTDGAPSTMITLAAGEETTVYLRTQNVSTGAAYSNKNVMCLIRLNEKMTDTAKLFVSAEVVPNTYTLTLAGAAKFEDGSKSVELPAGAVKPKIVDDIPSGYAVASYSYTDRSGNTVAYGINTFNGELMRDHDTTFTSHLVLAANGSGDGRLNLGGDLYYNNGASGVTRSICFEGGELAWKISFASMAAGHQFRILAPCKTTNDVVRTTTWHFRNYTEQDISFTLYMVNREFAVDGAPSVQVTIPALGTTEVSLDTKYTNQNLIPMFSFESDTQKAQFSVYGDVTVGS